MMKLLGQCYSKCSAIIVAVVSRSRYFIYNIGQSVHTYNVAVIPTTHFSLKVEFTNSGEVERLCFEKKW